ncbi:glutamine synthetase [Clostridia bacterium]|nr:glutamine synthetase [Clostridia bacterium]
MSNRWTKEDILQKVEEEDVEFIRLQFTDLFGNLKNVAITAKQLEKALRRECVFDGSSIEGFAKIEDSDLYFYPDLSSFTIFPWRPQQGKVARIICDIYRPDGTPFLGDPRYVLRKTIAKAKEMGYHFEVGNECEFFLFDTDENGNPTEGSQERGGYFDLGPTDLGENVRRDMVLALEDMGLCVEASHHEAAPAQHEIDFGPEEVLRAADDMVTSKLAIKTIARKFGLYASFMPKPKSGQHGSGLHLYFSLSKDGENVFCDTEDPLGLSPTARYFIGGLMRHIKGMSLILNPVVNSYKRLSSGYEAPADIAWSTGNRSPLIRIPSERGESTRIELRSPDSMGNPYLTLALSLAAGLDGITHKILPNEPVSGNINELSPKEKEGLGLSKLPATLEEAIAELKADTFLKEVLGSHVYEQYVKAKEEEWQDYSGRVTDWELEKYL